MLLLLINDDWLLLHELQRLLADLDEIDASLEVTYLNGGDTIADRCSAYQTAVRSVKLCLAVCSTARNRHL